MRVPAVILALSLAVCAACASGTGEAGAPVPIRVSPDSAEHPDDDAVPEFPGIIMGIVIQTESGDRVQKIALIESKVTGDSYEVSEGETFKDPDGTVPMEFVGWRVVDIWKQGVGLEFDGRRINQP